MTSRQAVGRRLKQIRGTISQDQFAEMLGCGQMSISRYEAGISYPPAEVMIAFSELTGISIDWLLMGEGTEPSPMTAD